MSLVFNLLLFLSKTIKHLQMVALNVPYENGKRGRNTLLNVQQASFGIIMKFKKHPS